jgi:hypothetical protein
MCLRVSYKKKYLENKFTEEGVGSGVGSRYLNQRYDPHQNVGDPQHC